MVDVSVLIPARDVATTITRAIDSALSQVDVSLEVIVCENGSRDNTATVIEAINDTRLTLICSQVNGIGAALNECAAVAVGRYFIELDGDDYFEPHCLAKMVQALDNTPSRIGFAHGCVQYHGDADYLYVPRQFSREDCWLGNVTLYPMMYKRQAWDSGCRYVDHIYAEGRCVSLQDWDWLLQLSEFMRYEGVPLPDVTVLHYQYNKQGPSQSLLERHEKSLLNAFQLRWPQVIKAQL